MTRTLLPFTIFCVMLCFGVSAHSPQVSMFTLSYQDKQWRLEGNFSQAAVSSVLNQTTQELAQSDAQLEIYRKRLLAYLTLSISLQQKGQSLKLMNGHAKIGNHQTDIWFDVETIHEDQPLSIQISAFEEIEHHTHFFKVRSKTSARTILLKPEESYRAVIEISADGTIKQLADVDEYTEETNFPEPEDEHPYLLVLLGICLLFTLIGFQKTLQLKLRGW